MHEISPAMVEEAIKKLNKRKCDPLSFLFTESFKNAPLNIYHLLSKIFSTMLSHGFSCDIFNSIKFSPLIKNKRKSNNNSNNYRAIAINSSLKNIWLYGYWTL